MYVIDILIIQPFISRISIYPFTVSIYSRLQFDLITYDSFTMDNLLSTVRSTTYLVNEL